MSKTNVINKTLVGSTRLFSLYRIATGGSTTWYETQRDLEGTELSSDGLSSLIRAGEMQEARDKDGLLLRVTWDVNKQGKIAYFHQVAGESELLIEWYPGNGKKAATYDYNKSIDSKGVSHAST